MRLTCLENFFGPSHLVGQGQSLSQRMSSGQIPSLLLWGFSGSDKATLSQKSGLKDLHHFNIANQALTLLAEAYKRTTEARGRSIRSR